MLPTRNPDLTSCDTCLLGRSSQCFIRSTVDEQVINKYKRVRHVQADTIVWNEFSRTDTVGLIIKGVLRVTQTTEDGKRKILGLYLPAEFFGNLFAQTVNCGLEAATDAQVCFFDQSDFEQLIETYPRLKQRVLLATLRQLAAAREFVALIAAHRTSERIARFFLACARLDKASGVSKIHLPIGRRDLAALVNTTPETVCRFITDLVRRGVLLRRTESVFSVADLPELEDIAGRSLTDNPSRMPVFNPAITIAAPGAADREQAGPSRRSEPDMNRFTPRASLRQVVVPPAVRTSVQSRRCIDG